MITRSCLFAIALLICYELYLLTPGAQSRVAVQSFWQDNLIRAQDYVLAKEPPHTVITGTSLSRGLAAEWFGDRCFNLSFIGGNVLTDLNLILRAPRRPEVVLIECNMLMKDETSGVMDNAFRPVQSSLRPLLLFLRERFQPANVAAWLLGDQLLRKILPLAGVPVQTTSHTDSIRDSARFATFLEQTRQAYAETLPADQLAAKIQRMRQAIDSLQKAGVRCYLVEMPMDEAVARAPGLLQIHEALAAAFPSPPYSWIRPGGNRNYETTDGLHLTTTELRAYASWIRARLDHPAAPGN